MRKAVRVHLPAVAAWALSAVLLLTPGSPQRPLPHWLLRLGQAGLDKAGHAAIFGALTAATARSAARLALARPLAAAALPAAAWSAASEGLQASIPYRDASLGDLAADGVGIGLGAALWLWRERRSRTS